MQFSLPFIDIIIFAIIAVFLIYRLKNILGQNSEGNDQNNKIDVGEKNFTNVVKLGNRQSNTKKTKTNKDSIQTIDPTFDEDEFLKGAKNFFEMVIDCFVKGDLKDTKNYIDDRLVKDFQSVIDDRLNEKESLKIDIIKMIHFLLKTKGMTINGVKNVLKSKLNKLDDYNSYSLKAEYYKKDLSEKTKNLLRKITKLKKYGKKNTH